MGRLIDCDDVYNAIQITTDNFGVAKNVVETNMLAMLSKMPTVEAIPKANVYKAILEIMKYEHEGFINISLARLDEILKNCGVSEDGNE